MFVLLLQRNVLVKANERNEACLSFGLTRKRRMKTNDAMDHFSKEQRTRIMAAIRSNGTRPEILVRHYLWRQGFRYRVNLGRLPGHPDIVLRKYCTCIFVNGCFWHGHDCGAFRLPKTRVDFWRSKIERNKQRDKEVQQRLATMGWHCITVWECQLKKPMRDQTLKDLAFTLNHLYLRDHAVGYRRLEEEWSGSMAAEPDKGE